MKALQGSPMARGRPKLDISPGEIKKLSQKGYGAKSIARQLSEKYGVPVSYQTVLRRLSNNGNGKHKS
jgi:intein-encoded DNA endonuclease-like protein